MYHKRINLFQCPQCGKAFLELCDLKRHTKRHLLKKAKRASVVTTNQESTTNPHDPSVGSINLMVLTDSLIFTESQQLLDNSQPRPDQVCKYTDIVLSYTCQFSFGKVGKCIFFSVLPIKLLQVTDETKFYDHSFTL